MSTEKRNCYYQVSQIKEIVTNNQYFIGFCIV